MITTTAGRAKQRFVRSKSPRAEQRLSPAALLSNRAARPVHASSSDAAPRVVPFGGTSSAIRPGVRLPALHKSTHGRQPLLYGLTPLSLHLGPSAAPVGARMPQ